MITGLMHRDVNRWFVEFYTTEAIADLSIYTLDIQASGGSCTTKTYTPAAASAPANQYLYFGRDDNGGDYTLAWFGEQLSIQTTSDSCELVTYNDPIRVKKSGTTIDQYGEWDSHSGTWTYYEDWVYRKCGLAATATFSTSDWTITDSNHYNSATQDSDAGVNVWPKQTYSLTCSPTTQGPTSASPTTLGPTSTSPSTHCPTSASPSTGMPSITPSSEAPSQTPSSRAPTITKSPSQMPSMTPTTVSPTTGNPTSFSPTTKNPTTEGPTTGNPTTSGPTTRGPTTRSPTTYGPSSQNPTTTGPTTRSPSTRNPTSLGPTTAGPTTQSPTTCGPTTDTPSRAPTTGSPTTDAPSQTPTSQVPSQTPTTIMPTTGNPSSGSPTTDTPSRAPTTGRPTTCGPTTYAPSQTPTTDHPTLSPVTNTPSTSPTTYGPTTAVPTRNPTSRSPTTHGPSTSPTSRAPSTTPTTRGPTTCNPSTCGPTTANPTMCPTSTHPSISPSTSQPSRSPTTFAPIGCSAGMFASEGQCFDCPRGWYCPDTQRRISCPANSTTDGTAKTALTDCACNPGWHGTVNTSEVAQKGDSTCAECVPGDYCPGENSQVDCPEGFYCNRTFSKVECSLGWYCPKRTHNTSYCPAGHYCNPTTSITACDIATVVGFGYYCPQGSTSQTPCLIGHYCPNTTVQISCGGNFSCPTGSYTLEECAAGYWCDQHSQQATLCTQGMYCPTGSLAAQNCSTGSYCTTTTLQITCLQGKYCPESSIEESSCPAGFFCASPSSLSKCANGSYCPKESTTPQACPLGSYCPTPDQKFECASGFYCPENSTTATLCPAGYYCETPSTITECRIGSYCTSGSTSMTTCPTGSYCTNTTSKVECQAGHYCPANSSAPTNCTTGNYCPLPTLNLTCSTRGVVFCPEASVDPTTCQEGFYCPDAAQQIECVAGQYCPAGTQVPSQCSNGSFCQSPSFQTVCDPGDFCPNNATAAVSCAAGHYCPITSTQIACALGDYCPERSTTNSKCPSGSYCPDTKTAILCTGGQFCPQGSTSPMPCPAGSYCPTVDSNLTCHSETLGYYCPENSTARNPCTIGFYCPTTTEIYECAPGSYCPAGTTAPQMCARGSYCPSPVIQIACISSTKAQYCAENSTNIATCPAESFCTNTSFIKACDGGYYCPEGSFAQTACQAGYYCPNATAQIICPIGTYAPAGSPSCVECPASAYCPTLGAETFSSCVTGAISEPGSTLVTDCECDRSAGYSGTIESTSDSCIAPVATVDVTVYLVSSSAAFLASYLIYLLCTSRSAHRDLRELLYEGIQVAGMCISECFDLATDYTTFFNIVRPSQKLVFFVYPYIVVLAVATSLVLWSLWRNLQILREIQGEAGRTKLEKERELYTTVSSHAKLYYKHWIKQEPKFHDSTSREWMRVASTLVNDRWQRVKDKSKRVTRDAKAKLSWQILGDIRRTGRLQQTLVPECALLVGENAPIALMSLAMMSFATCEELRSPVFRLGLAATFVMLGVQIVKVSDFYAFKELVLKLKDQMYCVALSLHLARKRTARVRRGDDRSVEPRGREKNIPQQLRREYLRAEDASSLATVRQIAERIWDKFGGHVDKNRPSRRVGSSAMRSSDVRPEVGQVGTIRIEIPDEALGIGVVEKRYTTNRRSVAAWDAQRQRGTRLSMASIRSVETPAQSVSTVAVSDADAKINEARVSDRISVGRASDDGYHIRRAGADALPLTHTTLAFDLKRPRSAGPQSAHPSEAARDALVNLAGHLSGSDSDTTSSDELPRRRRASTRSRRRQTRSLTPTRRRQTRHGTAKQPDQDRPSSRGHIFRVARAAAGVHRHAPMR